MAATGEQHPGGQRLLGGVDVAQPHWLAYAASVRKDYILMEVDPALLQDLQSHGAVFKSQQDGAAVLCTQSHTYDIKSVETTNLLMLVPPKDAEDLENTPPEDTDMQDVQATQGASGLMTQAARNQTADDRARVKVTATADRHLELVRTSPKLSVLDELLAEAPYAGQDNDPQSGLGGYTFNEVLERVPCSEDELRQALECSGAMEISGRWRNVDSSYLTDVLHILLLSAVEKDWPSFAMPVKSAISVLQEDGYEPDVVRHCLASFSTQDGVSGMDIDGTLALAPEKVCVAFARALLRTEQWPLVEFMQAWEKAIPMADIRPAESMLSGVALIVRHSGVPYVKRFDVMDLPKHPGERFAILFRERASWVFEDLDPYLKNVEAKGQSVEALLLRYTRAVQKTPADPTSYTAR